MVYEAKGKWKTIKLPKSQSKHNSLCKGIEVLDNYVLQVGNKRKPEILDAPLTQIKKKKNTFEENEDKDENENCATPGKYVLANGNQNKKEDTVAVTKEEKGKKKNKNKNNIKDAKTEEKKVESEKENKNENNKKKRKHKKKEKKPIINLDVIAEFLKKKEAGPTVVEADSNVVKAGPNVVEADSTTEEPKNEEVKNKNKTKKVNKAGKVKAENKTEKVKVNKNTEKVKVNKNTEEKDKDESEVEDETEEVADENKTEEVNDEKDKNKDLDMSEWKKLHVCDEIIEALRVKGFSKPTEIQKLALPSALSGEFTSKIVCMCLRGGGGGCKFFNRPSKNAPFIIIFYKKNNSA